jgi:hypothetical protein
LYDRVVSGQGLINQTAPATERFIALSAPFTVRELTDIRFAPGRHDDLQNNLIVKGLDYWDVDEMMRAVAYEGIRTAPLAFITFSFHEAWTQYFDDPTPMLAWWSIPPAYPPELESGPILGVRAGSLLWRELLGQQFAVIWKWVPWIALIGVVLVPLMHERLILLGIVLLPSGYLLSLAFLELEVPRYTAAVVPFVFAVAAVAPAATLGLLQGPTRATIDRLSWQRIRNWVRSSAVRASD